MVHISIRYCTSQSPKWKEINVSPEEFFHTSPDKAKYETWEIDSVHKFCSILLYLPETDREHAKQVVTHIMDDSQNAVTFRESFWNSGMNQLCESLWNRNGEIDEELILTSTLLVEPEKIREVTEIIRLSRKDAVYFPTLHTIMDETCGEPVDYRDKEMLTEADKRYKTPFREPARPPD